MRPGRQQSRPGRIRMFPGFSANRSQNAVRLSPPVRVQRSYSFSMGVSPRLRLTSVVTPVKTSGR